VGIERWPVAVRERLRVDLEAALTGAGGALPIGCVMPV
jgi:hypothetical protein